MNNDLKKLLLCLKWDVDNIEDLNNKRDYISNRIADIQELVKNCSIPVVVGRSEQLVCDVCDVCDGSGLMDYIVKKCECTKCKGSGQAN